MEEQHIYNHSDRPARVNVTVERNTKGFNYGATVVDATSVEEALTLLDEALAGLRARFEQA